MSNPSSSAGPPSNQASIVVYTTASCPYCVRAKSLLRERGYAYREINVEGDDAKRAWLVQATGRRTVPQIFIDERSIGGFDDLAALDRAGKLAALVQGEKAAP